MILGGSTNAVLHLIAVAHSVGIKLTIDDFQMITDKTPVLADLKFVLQFHLFGDLMVWF